MEICRLCEAAYPLEACGILLGTGDGERVPWQVSRIRSAPNEEGGDRRHRYLVPPRIQCAAELEARLSGEQVLGYYHSHPDGPALPSEYDREHAWAGYLYVICSVVQARTLEVAAFALSSQGGPFRRVRLDGAGDLRQPTWEVPPCP